jgi:hypothetical protein
LEANIEEILDIVQHKLEEQTEKIEELIHAKVDQVDG